MTVKLRCPYCNAFGIEQLQTTSLDSETKVVFCGQCGAIHGVVGAVVKPLPQNDSPANVVATAVKPTFTPQPLPQKAVTPPPPQPLPQKSPSQLKFQALVEQMGRADLAKKRDEYEDKLEKRAQAVQKGSTHYLQVAYDDGPPHCLNCQVDMKAVTIPQGYLNADCKVWVCPNLCGEWEADALPPTEKSTFVIESVAVKPNILPEKPLPVFEPRIIKPKPTVLLTDPQVHHAAFTVPDLAFILSEILKQPVSLTDSQSAQMLMYATDKVSHSFVCHLHVYQLVKLVVPKGLPQAQRLFWACPMYRSCHHWFWLGETQPTLEHPKITSPCPKCGFQLRKMSIPQGYADAGKMMWVCQNCQHYAKVD